MPEHKVAPYGSWGSPISSDLIVRGVVGLSEVVIDDDDVYWMESRPGEDGRNVDRTPDPRREHGGRDAATVQRAHAGPRVRRRRLRRPRRHGLLLELRRPEDLPPPSRRRAAAPDAGDRQAIR